MSDQSTTISLSTPTSSSESSESGLMPSEGPQLGAPQGSPKLSEDDDRQHSLLQEKRMREFFAADAAALASDPSAAAAAAAAAAEVIAAETRNEDASNTTSEEDRLNSRYYFVVLQTKDKLNGERVKDLIKAENAKGVLRGSQHQIKH
ncbi:hypothetical protein Emed_002963 [Eimeria media]